MIKNKKGVTLIELLVTMAILVTILILVIISMDKVSDKQKDSALEKVKEQASTAAQQFFSSNEYLFEGLEENATGIISVGKLVKEGFINTLTNPKTGKK